MDKVNTDGPVTWASCQQTLAQLVEEYPFLVWEDIGASVFQRSISALTFGWGPRRVLYTAAHHANEWLTTLVLLRFARELSQALASGGRIYGVAAETIARAATVCLVPMVDPDGVDLVTGAIPAGSVAYDTARQMAQSYPQYPFPQGWKANLLGVDLNLQYPAGWEQAREIKFSQGFTRPGPRDYVGSSPLGQMESRALARFTEAFDPALILAYHSQGRVIYWKYGDVEVAGAKALGEEFARLSGYTLADTPYASGFAGYKDWFIQTFRRPGYTVEVGQGENPLPISQLEEIYRDNLGILVTAALGLPEDFSEKTVDKEEEIR